MNIENINIHHICNYHSYMLMKGHKEYYYATSLEDPLVVENIKKEMLSTLTKEELEIIMREDFDDLYFINNRLYSLDDLLNMVIDDDVFEQICKQDHMLKHVICLAESGIKTHIRCKEYVDKANGCYDPSKYDYNDPVIRDMLRAEMRSEDPRKDIISRGLEKGLKEYALILKYWDYKAQAHIRW